MSGSSLDGLDFAICRFVLDFSAGVQVSDWSILAAATDPYPPTWRARLETAPFLPGRELWRLHADLGHWVGQRAAAFLSRHPDHLPALIGSHGHTVFHDPVRHFTTQIGDGAAIAERTGLTTVAEFRGADVAAGGQGAPIAPVADKYLFPNYPAFLNLGGIANLSVRLADGKYLAGDISGCCQILDRLAQIEGLPYDKDGQLAAAGKFLPDLAEQLGGLDFHAQPYPKALGNNWVRESLWPILQESTASVPDRLHTFCKWLSVKIAVDIEGATAYAAPSAGAEAQKNLTAAGEAIPHQVLVTGGGANNRFLLQQLQKNQAAAGSNLQFVVPDPQLADFKEAALMALCAVLRLEGQPNSLASATGASRDTVNGAVYLPTPN